MDRDEILAKSRNEKMDEGLVFAEHCGRKLGVGVLCFLFGFIVLFNFFHGESSYAPMAMFFAFLAVEAYPRYRFTGDKGVLIIVIAGAIACLASLGSLIVTTLR